MAHVFRVYEPAAGEGPEVALSPEETHHVRRVLRLAPGDEIAVFDGRGREWRATLERYDGGSAMVALGEELGAPVESPLAVHLYQACARADRLDWIVQKGTEIGLASIVAFGAERADVERSARRLDRLERIAIEAAKQCGRRRLPRLDAVASLPDADPDGLALVLDPRAAHGIGSACGVVARSVAWIAVGPESGLAPEEIDRATSAGWRAASLGPRVLRAETAGLVAAAIVLHRLGDLGP